MSDFRCGNDPSVEATLTDEARAELREFAEYLKQKQAYRVAFAAWEAGGRVGDPPPRPVPPHTPSGSLAPVPVGGENV